MEKSRLIEKLQGSSNWATWLFDIDLEISVNNSNGLLTGTTVRPVEEDFKEKPAEYLTACKTFNENDAKLRFLIVRQLQERVPVIIVVISIPTTVWMIRECHGVHHQ